MDTNSGTIMQFQDEEEEKKMRELLAKLYNEPPASVLQSIGRLPREGCEFCNGRGALRSTTTMKWIPCRCTNPEIAK